MKKEDLIAMGLSEEQATALIEKYGTMVPKTQFDEVDNAKKALETQIADRDKQLTTLQEKAKGNEDLTAQIKALQEANDQTKTEYEQQLKDERLSSALKLALAGKAQDAEIVASLLDKTKVEVDEKGAIKGGLDDQLKTLKESKPFLFVPEKKVPEFKGWNPAGGDGGASGELDAGSAFAKQFNEKGAVSSDAPNPWG